MKWRYDTALIGNLVSSVKKWNPRTCETRETFTYIDIASVDRETKNIEETNDIFTDEAPSRARQLVQSDDVLVSTVRPNLNAVAQVRPAFNGATASTGFAVLRAKQNKLDSRYLYYWVRTPYFVEDMTRQSTGASYPAVSDSIIKKHFIPLPPIAEQRRIAAILDKADGIRRDRKQAIQYTEELLRSAFLDMFGDYSKMNLVALEDLAAETKHSLSSGPFGSNLTSSHYVDEGVLVLRGKNVTGGELDFTDVKYVSEEKSEELSRSSLKSGDVVIVAVGASGAALSLPKNFPSAVMSQNFNKITPDIQKVESIYLARAINSTFVQNQLAQNITDTVRTFLSLTKLRKIQIPLPSMSLQRRFVDMCMHVESSQKRYKLMFDESNNLFNSLLQRAFKGDL